MSVQIHVPLALDDSGWDNGPRGLPAGHGAGPLGPSPFGTIGVRLKKVDNRTVEETGASAFAQLPKRKAVDIEFQDLTYTVSEGRKKGERKQRTVYA